ncbi:MAG: IS66 family transposase zinc-finger binding domain-containing protein [Conexivisphaerales archaeon]
MKVDETVELDQSTCPRCSGMLSEKPTDAYTRVIEDIVPARVVVMKYVIRRRYCCKCGKRVPLPISNVLSGGNERFGLRLMLLITSLKLLGLSYEKISSLLKLLFGLDVTEAAMVHSVMSVSSAFGPRYDELREELRKEASLHGDETSWMIKGGTTGSGPSWAGGASYTRWLNLAARMCRRGSSGRIIRGL